MFFMLRGMVLRHDNKAMENYGFVHENIVLKLSVSKKIMVLW